MPASNPVEQARAALLKARDVEATVRAAASMRALPALLLEQGVAADAITELISALDDLVVRQLALQLGLEPALRARGACWLALGSQGRMEQTLATDQDNAIVFADGTDPDEARRALLGPALEMNHALDRCGFALCRGKVMASNPDLCLSYSEWSARFAAWIDRPEPEALLNGAIYFDFRPVAGDPAAADALRRWLADSARSADRFLLLMVFNALRNSPPLGVLRDFALSRGGEHPHTMDLKVNAVQIFVEAARIFALASGVTATSTAARLRDSHEAMHVPAAEMEGWRRAFCAIQGLRLRLNAQQMRDGTAVHNHLDPSTLEQSARVILKDALRQARDLQNCLASRFSLSGTALRA